MILIGVLGWLLVSVFLLVSIAFIVEVLLGLLASRPAAVADGDSAAHSAVILVPAHNEEKVIGKFISLLKDQLPPRTKILLVADNCTDATAEIARDAGVDVVERVDRNFVGKGYALRFGQSLLEAGPPEIVVVLDADCNIDRLSLKRLIDVAAARRRPVQAAYLLRAAATSPPMVQVSNFAFMVKNDLRQRGAALYGAAAILTGTGMAFPWEVFKEVHFSGGSVEDLDLTVALVEGGVPPVFLPDAIVLSDAAAMAAAQMQRDRWERGFLATAWNAVPRLISSFAKTRKMSVLWLALHLMTPPLALLILVGGAFLLLLGVLYVGAGMSLGPILAQLLLLLLISLLVACAWSIHGRAYLSPRMLLSVPLYVLWKLPIYLRMLKGAERRWNRTERIRD